MFKNIIPSPGPVRTLAISQMINCIGEGAYYVCVTLFFTQIVGFTPAELGIGLTISWIVALLVGVPVGHFVDRFGPRRMAVLLAIGASLAIFSYLFIHSISLFVIAACIYTTCSRGVSAARSALVARAVDTEKISEAKGYIQSSFNLGLSVGAALGGIALMLGTKSAYWAILSLDALSILVAAWLILKQMPEVRTENHSTEKGKLTVLRDKPYFLISIINAILMLHIPLIDVALPLWILNHTEAPAWIVAVLFIFNTLSVVFFMKYFSSGVTNMTSAIRYVSIAGVLLFFSCLIFSVSEGKSVLWSVILLLLAALVQVVGEMIQFSGTWQISFGLAPQDKQGEYQSFFGSGLTIAEMIGPFLLTNLVVYQGMVGWICLGVAFVVAGFAMGPAVRWAERANRPFNNIEQLDHTVN
ncbi:MFS transporter [Bacillus cereus group sp. BfR-BA-01383]|uniref:MFS transporter n=1 Tax=Bacillus cereus group sp. BfR-BA-01383 TaxID=2920327 RepID=UPI001F57D2C1|nr:MFS transporter [Bacillus cereus group sp. BfR-BA-01383]